MITDQSFLKLLGTTSQVMIMMHLEQQQPFGGWNTLTYYNNYTKANERILSTEWVGSRGYWDLPFETEWITAQKSTTEFGKYDLTDDLLYFIAHKYKQYEN